MRSTRLVRLTVTVALAGALGLTGAGPALAGGDEPDTIGRGGGVKSSEEPAAASGDSTASGGEENPDGVGRVGGVKSEDGTDGGTAEENPDGQIASI